jgi:hypothetical protein
MSTIPEDMKAEIKNGIKEAFSTLWGAKSDHSPARSAEFFFVLLIIGVLVNMMLFRF